MAATGSVPANAPLTLDAVTLPARVHAALRHQFQAVGAETVRQLHVVLHETELELGRVLDRQRTLGSQTSLLESIRRLGSGADAFVAAFLRNLEHGLASLQAARVSRRLEDLTATSDGLSLVDEREMDEGAVLGSIAARGESRNRLALQLMGHRYGVLAAAPAFDAEHLPLGPNALCHALRSAATEIDLALDARIVLYRQFEKIAMAHYPALLESLNTRLVDDGVLPHLSFVPLRVRRATPGIPRPMSDHASVRTAQAANPSPTSTGREDQAFAALQEQLARRRTLLAKLRPGSGDERMRTLLTPETVLLALHRMRNSDARHASAADIRQTVLAQARQAHGHGVALAAAEYDAFELYGLFLTQLQRELRRGGPAEPLLARLRLPLLQLCVRDHSFFVDPQHPARQLLDAVSLAGARWLADDDLDAQALGLLQRAVGSVLEDPDAMPDTFLAANHALQGGLQSIGRKNQMAERRQVEAARGRERLLLARHRAAQEIAQHAAGRTLPRFNAMLLEQAWTDVLALALLRGGEGSQGWRELSQTTAALVEASLASTHPGLEPALVARLQEALASVGYHADDAAAITRLLANGRADEDELSSRTELIVQLKARARLGEEQVARAGAPARARTAAEDAAYARLAELADGCWIELQDTMAEGMVRRRLAWTSALSDQALLLNRRGARVAEEHTLDSLARMLADDRLRVLEEDLYPAEQAWRATHASLQRIADTNARETGSDA